MTRHTQHRRDGMAKINKVGHVVYFFDPDGNRLEIFAEKMSPEEGRRVLRQGGGTNKPLALEPSLT
jgi:hypothetical protein